MLSDRPIFIGLAGTLNAGKDSLAEALADEYGFLHMSTSDMIRLMKKREYGADSPQALLLRNDPYINNLRAERGPGFLIEEIYNDWKKNKDKYPSGFVASGMRATGEAEEVQRVGGINVFIDADPQIRYERAIARGRDANEKGKTFEEFMATERLETDVDPEDKTIQNIAGLKQMADIVIENDHESIKAFQEDAIRQLKEFMKSKMSK